MMKQITQKDCRENALIGKTIKGYSKYRCQLIITFTDDTFIIYHAKCDNDNICDDEMDITVESTFWLLHWVKDDALLLGICTQEEYNREWEKFNKQCEDNAVARRRAEYERLKKEFEPQS